MPKAPSKSAAAIQRLLEERRQYEAWLARITATADSAPEHVRTRVRADYEARLKAVTEELRAHADAARQLIAQRKENLIELQRKENAAAERLAENAPSPRRASGAQFQPDDPQNATPVAPIDENAPVEKTLKCKECGTMNVATEWYCEKCGGELAAM